MLVRLSRLVREGPPARVLPGRCQLPLERWTVSRAYPPVSPALEFPAPGRFVTSLIFGGDLALHHLQVGADPSAIFGGLAALTSSAGAVVVNLESQFAADLLPAGTIGTTLGADPAHVDVLRLLGVRAVTCANNHCLDFGARGLQQSVKLVEAAGVEVTGVAGSGIDDGPTLDVNGLRLGLLAYTDDWREGPASRGDFAPRPHEPGQIRRDIADLRARTDVVAVQVHWGYEWSMYPARAQRDLARSYIDAGAWLVICHHAHVPMGVERWGGGLIAHGLGNLYFGRSDRPDRHPFRNASFVLRVTLMPAGKACAEVVPVYTDRADRVGPAPACVAQRVLRAVGYLSSRLNDDRYLEAVERSLIARQGCSLIIDLARRLAAGDEAAVLERIWFLAPPRQRQLGLDLAAREEPLAAIGHCLNEVRDSPGDIASPAVRDRIRFLAAQAQRVLVRCRQLGRIP